MTIGFLREGLPTVVVGAECLQSCPVEDARWTLNVPESQPSRSPPQCADDDNPLVARLMTTPIVAIVLGAPLTVALRLPATRRVGHLPMVNGSRCIGMLLDTDIAHLLT